LKIEPNNLEGLWKLSISYLNSKSPDYSNAIMALKKLETLDPENWQIVLKIANCYRQYKKMDSATVYFSKALNMQPENKEVLRDIGSFYIILRNWEEAKKHLIKGKELYPNDYRFPLKLGSCQEITEDYENAKNNLESALLLCPKENLDEIYNILASLYLRTNDYANALKYAQLAYKVNPKDAYVLMQLGRILMFTKKDFIQARKYLEQALKKSKEDIIYGNLGHLDLLEGHEDSALIYYKKCVEHFKSFKDFERFDYDRPYMIKFGVAEEKYNSIKGQMVLHWKEIYDR